MEQIPETEAYREYQQIPYQAIMPQAYQPQVYPQQMQYYGEPGQQVYGEDDMRIFPFYRPFFPPFFPPFYRPWFFPGPFWW